MKLHYQMQREHNLGLLISNKIDRLFFEKSVKYRGRKYPHVFPRGRKLTVRVNLLPWKILNF